MLTRREKILHGLNLAETIGAEIGPLDRPLVARGDGRVVYVDHSDQESIRRKYRDDKMVDTSKIAVDAVWGQDTLAEAIRKQIGVVELDYVVASHVIEHVPDLVTWLQEIKASLHQNGQLRLAIPDRRFTFDILRRNSDLSAVLAAFAHRARIPSAHSILDFCLHETPVNAVDAWAGRLSRDDLLKNRPHTVSGALAVAADAIANGNYHDVHCWTFTPYSFVQLLRELTRSGLVAFSCVEFFDTEVNELEFFAILQPCKDPSEAEYSWQLAADRIVARRLLD